MAVKFDERLKVKCIAEGEWIPHNITVTEWYPVIGINTWQFKDDKGKIKTVIKFIVINDQLQLTQIAEFNCQVLSKEDPDKNIEIQKPEKDEDQPF